MHERRIALSIYNQMHCLWVQNALSMHFSIENTWTTHFDIVKAIFWKCIVKALRQVQNGSLTHFQNGSLRHFENGSLRHFKKWVVQAFADDGIWTHISFVNALCISYICKKITSFFSETILTRPHHIAFHSVICCGIGRPHSQWCHCCTLS